MSAGMESFGIQNPQEQQDLRGDQNIISKTFSRAEVPCFKKTVERGMPKCPANALAMAEFALPSMGGSFTAILKWVSSICSTRSSLAFALAVTNIFTLLLYHKK